MPKPLRQRVMTMLGIFSLCLALTASVRVSDGASVKETVDEILDRLVQRLSPLQLYYLSNRQIEHALTAAEKRILGNEHISFRANVPATVYIVRGPTPRDEPFWLKDRGFAPLTLPWVHEKQNFETWKRDFPSGLINLGVNSLTGGGTHYLVLAAPQNPADSLRLTGLQPVELRTSVLTNGVNPYYDEDEVLTEIPSQFIGHTLVQTPFELRDAARIRDRFQWTPHPALSTPDHVILTWSGDPRTTQTVQWRTSDRVRKGYVRYSRKPAVGAAASNAGVLEVEAKTEPIHTKFIVNDRVIRHHTVVLTNLEPATTYIYAVGDGSNGGWSSSAEFTTAPNSPTPFSFIYMGDAQTGLYRWGSLLRSAYQSRPDAAFYLIAGDLVNRGADRDDWDTLLHNARGVFDRRPFIPVIGNHDCLGGNPTLYLRYFDLPKNGPPKIEAERAYSFEYSNALFVVLDSNLEPASQTAWLEQQLARTKATWKFVSYHHPAYSSAPNRDNPEIRSVWGSLFDKYHVDVALQGHDHSYLRTFPMKNGAAVPTPDKGTIYVVSVSGTKMYEQHKREYTAVGLTNLATYQVIDISNNRLTYRATDIDGKVHDQFEIEKPLR